jgi:hypothetical protein
MLERVCLVVEAMGKMARQITGKKAAEKTAAENRRTLLRQHSLPLKNRPKKHLRNRSKKPKPKKKI